MQSRKRQRTQGVTPRRAALAAGCTLVGLYLSLGVGLDRINPAASANGSLFPTNPVSLGNTARNSLELNAENGPSALLLAQNALRRDPTVISAVTAAALQYDISGDKKRANALFKYSLSLSQRDLTTHLWFIEEATARNDLNSALEHYDASLRTSQTSRAILMPLLVNAVFDESLSGPIATRVAQAPPWASELVSKSVSTAGPTKNLLQFLSALQSKGYALDRADLAVALDRATNANLYTEAFKLSGRDAGSRGLINGNFSADSKYPPFDWKIDSSPDHGAELQQSAQGTRELRIYGGSGVGGEVARQALLLPPGRYELAVTSSRLAQASSQRPYVSIFCAGNASQEKVLTVDISGSADRLSTTKAAFSVPAANCGAQWLRLYARPADTDDGTNAVLKAVTIRPEAIAGSARPN